MLDSSAFRGVDCASGRSSALPEGERTTPFATEAPFQFAERSRVPDLPRMLEHL